MKIKVIISIIFALILALVIILFTKTLVHPFYKTESTNNGSTLNTSASEKAIKRFAGGIRIPTISTDNYEETNFKPFDEFKAYLSEAYPIIYKNMDTLTVNKYGLVFHWKGKNQSLKPILFLAHYDVVPVIGYDPQTDIATDTLFQPTDNPIARIDSIQSKWDYSPFSGAVVDGRIYGRGTIDMKCMLFSLFEAAETLITEGYQPEQDIWFAFGQDEEVGGQQGAALIASYFKDKGLIFDAVYDEGGIIAAPGSALESIKKPMALIGTGEKGFLTLRIKAFGLGGHSSMPPAKSSLVYIAEIIEKLNKNQMKAQIIPPISSFLNNIGGEMDFISRMAIANQWLLKPLLFSSLSKSPTTNALIRTTTAITMARGSDAPNVLTSVSEVTVNFRILPGETINDVINHVKELCKGYDVEIETMIARESSSVSPENINAFKVVKKTIEQLYPNAIVSSYITVGGTDAYQYQAVSDNIYRFLPIDLNLYEQRTMHNENEHITIDNYGKMIWYFQELMKTYQNGQN
ncbi:M20/M25/M40 family metallo-hydrolase [Dysgonomonas sp. HGC4]|uniref:M20/M25/M40 family metallo-hydrolase n=1 Tax=Dysgonomonas sp. HGC4 TaxID=1658009 RepID=UPI0006808F9F|nr:M20/M25/M40 family metallo-hydrolase [Dysgonomonas sp. HGC4]MBD8347948.1 M20/M25/M40 family metallo-hydrolase [Dysgonomonas sp. HGC4]